MIVYLGTNFLEVGEDIITLNFYRSYLLACNSKKEKHEKKMTKLLNFLLALPGDYFEGNVITPPQQNLSPSQQPFHPIYTDRLVLVIGDVSS